MCICCHRKEVDRTLQITPSSFCRQKTWLKPGDNNNGPLTVMSHGANFDFRGRSTRPCSTRITGACCRFQVCQLRAPFISGTWSYPGTGSRLTKSTCGSVTRGQHSRRRDNYSACITPWPARASVALLTAKRRSSTTSSVMKARHTIRRRCECCSNLDFNRSYSMRVPNGVEKNSFQSEV